MKLGDISSLDPNIIIGPQHKVGKFLLIQEFTKLDASNITKKENNYIVFNEKEQEQLGWINYYSPWKRFVFTAFSNNIIFDVTCLRDIVKFIKEI